MNSATPDTLCCVNINGGINHLSPLNTVALVDNSALLQRNFNWFKRAKNLKFLDASGGGNVFCYSILRNLLSLEVLDIRGCNPKEGWEQFLDELVKGTILPSIRFIATCHKAVQVPNARFTVINPKTIKEPIPWKYYNTNVSIPCSLYNKIN